MFTLYILFPQRKESEYFMPKVCTKVFYAFLTLILSQV